MSDGHDDLKVASRFGVLWLRRRVLCRRGGRHVLPGNAVLPAHQGMVLTRGLQEVACLWPQDLSLAATTRLLGWQTQDEHVLSETTVRTLVRQHGQILARAEATEIAALAPPLPQSPTTGAIHRVDILGGIIHDYERRAA